MVDSAAVGWLMSSAAQFKKHGGKLVLHSPTELVQQMFRFMNMQKLVPIAKDEAAARLLMAAAPPAVAAATATVIRPQVQ